VTTALYWWTQWIETVGPLPALVSLALAIGAAGSLLFQAVIVVLRWRNRRKLWEMIEEDRRLWRIVQAGQRPRPPMGPGPTTSRRRVS